MLLLSLASSAATLSVQAVVDADLQRVTGQLQAEPGLSFSDPLARLPQPQDDLTFSRTYPGGVDEGEMAWTESGGVMDFQTRLPKRYGAVGVERGALWANGAWYPQPGVDAGSEGVHDWTVTLTLPPGSVGVINGVAGQGTLEWSGQAERLSIAVFDGGELLELAPGVQLLSRGLERPRRDEQLAQLMDLLPEGSRNTVVVEAPMFRRLVRTGPGVLYLSDMAWRTPKPLWRFHNRAVLQGLVQAAVDHPSRLLQELYAAALTPTLEEQLSSNTADQFLRWGAFLPLVDMLLYSGRVPFHAELFGEVYPGDPLRDDLAELYSERPSGQVLAVKIDDAEGAGTALEWAEQWLEEQDLYAIHHALSPWIGPWPEQDYQLSVTPQDSGFLVNVARQTEPNAASEVVTLDIDGAPHRYESGVGPGEHQLLLDERPKRVALDPNKHLHQQDLSGDVWPARWTAVGTVAPQTYNLSERILVGYGVLRLRKRYDTHNLYMLSASTDAQNALSARATYLRYFGPLQDRRLRNQRVSVWAGGSWLSSNYRETVDGRYALEMGASAVVDTRVDWRFPIQGHRMAAGADLGVVPESGQRWSSGSLSLSGVRAVHPRAVFAGALSGGVALGEVQHRLLSLGGPMSSLPPGLIVGQGRAVAAGELRILAFKNLSVPLAWLYWLDEVQFTTGLEVGTVRKASVVEEGEIGALSSQAQALGWTGSVLLTMDGLGAIPWTVGVVLGVPVWTEGLPESAPQLGLTLGQAF
ncbi:MAG: hypothetical protein ACI9VR_000865 [Cognaticolwellia sp.]|jgi:hypothetical protein